MSILLEKLRKKAQNVLTVTKDESLIEQINAIKKNLYIDTTLATLLHSNHFDQKWNPRVYNKIQEHIDSTFKKRRHENIKKVIFEYLDGWVGKEDVDGLTMYVFPSSMGDISYDPKDSKDFDTITEIIRAKIEDIFPLSTAQALALSIEYMSPNMFKGEDLWGNLGLKPLNEHTKRKLNPKVKPGDHIRVISLDHDTFPAGEYEHEYIPPEEYSLGRVDMVYQDETPDGEEVTMLRVYFPELETDMEEEGFGDGYSDISDDGIRIIVDPYDKYVKSDDVLTEAGMIGGGRKPRRNIPDSIRGNLVQAIFTREGGWGRPSQKFIIFMTPMGSIADIQQSSGMPNSQIPFEVDQKVSFGDLYKFEQDSPFDLQMKGRLSEHDEQLNLFPTGQWDFPVGWDEESIEAVIEGVPEKIIPYIFKQWDEHGIEFRDLKLLGIQATSDIAVFLMKRYLQNTNQPVIANHVFACDDLANLFDDTSSDYDLNYIKEFLCGGESFWDSEDWYNYEWDDYMTDQIDENNWKTISEIFGGVSQSVAEDILNRSSSSEEVDELTEKYDYEIDEIRNFIVWAHNDETEWAIKDAMKNDIIDKLKSHFGADGELYRSDEDWSYSWHFEDDLRNWVNDGVTWDNIERFEFHPDYAGTTLEDSLIDTSPEYLNEKTLFAALIDEEYMFHDYCEGKKGDCLEVETRWFDGYYIPDYDINDSLSDRLGELTYEPEQITSGPEGEIKPLHEQQTLWGNGVMDREKEWCEDDENWLCNVGSENLGFSDLYKGDGFDIIHQIPGDTHLSDLSPEEEETNIPKGSKKYKDLKMKPSLHKGPFNIPVIQEQEQEQKLRIKTIYEDDNWKYIWPLNDYSFCQLAKETSWCHRDEKPFESYGTSYILQDKKSDEKWKFDDREVVPGLPSHDVTIKTKDNTWLNKHRFLADKPNLHDMFQQTYTTFDKMKYGVKLEDTILEDFADTNKFSEAVYNMIKNPSSENEDKLIEFIGNNLIDGNPYIDTPLINTVLFGNHGVSIYYEEAEFKEKIMGVYDDDDWFFDMGTDRYYDDHCEEMDEEELQYVDYHMLPESKTKLDDMVTLFGDDPSKYNWDEEGTLDQAMQDLVPELWEANYWELLDAIGCAVGRSRVKGVAEYLEQDKVLEYEFIGGNPSRLWKLDITYVQLLYIIGDKKINSFSEIEDVEINHVDGGLNDVWYDAWDVDKEGIDDFNDRLSWFIDTVKKEYGDDARNLKLNREKFKQVTEDLGFKQKWTRGNLHREMKVDGGTKTVEIKSYDPKDNKLEILISQPEEDEEGEYRTQHKRYSITLDELSDYTLAGQLDLN